MTTKEAFAVALQKSFDHGFAVGFKAGSEHGIDLMEYLQEVTAGAEAASEAALPA
jgi:hypothetical protein